MNSGARLRLDYFDQNEDFARCLPCEGTIEREPACADSRKAWVLVRLDEPLLYEGARYGHVLLTARHDGGSVEEGEHVYVLLVPLGAPAVPDGFSYRDYLHVAWGVVGRARKPSRAT